MELKDDYSPPPPPPTTSTDANQQEDEESLGETSSNLDQILVDNNISGASNHSGNAEGSGEQVESKTTIPNNVKETGILETPSEVKESSPPATKGYGLKKWRRIRRDSTKEVNNTVDSSKVLKRGASPSAAEPSKPRDPNSDIRQTGEASADSSVRSPLFPSGLFTKGSSSDSRLAVGLGYAFPAGTDSENSEDRSSKSSTAASAPKPKYVSPMVMGSTRERNKAKSANAKASGILAQKSQLGKGRTETSKKLRGERVKVEKDTSYSSVESDLRSFAFADMGISGMANGTQGERSVNYEGENSYEAQASDQQSNEEVQTGYCKDNGREAEYVSQDDEAADVSWEAKEEESDNQRPSRSLDQLAESMLSLQDVQEALAKEIQKFGEIGKEPILPHDDSVRCLDLTSETNEPNSFSPLETELVKSKQKVHFLERRLEETLAVLGVKESRVIELEGILNKSKLHRGESGSTLQSLQEECREMEIEIEDLFKKKIEAEVECLAIKTSQKLKVASKDHIALFEEQKSLIGEQNQGLCNLRDKYCNLVGQKEQTSSFGDTLEAPKLPNRVCKVAVFLFVQLMLLILVVWVFLQLPHSAEVIPT